MATVDDIGTPGQPLGTPPITEWQKAVRDSLNPLKVTTTPVPAAGGWTGNGSVSKHGRLVTFNLTANKATWAGGELCCTIPAGYRPALALYFAGGISGSGATALFLVQTDGRVTCVLAGAAGSGGVIGATAWTTP